jgi:MoxR-like ATPase
LTPLPQSVDATLALLSAGRYVATRELAVAVFLSLRLQRPLLLEGEAGVGKTEIAKTLAEGLGRELIRLQCYEGLDAASALYEWNHLRQILEIRIAEAAGERSREALSATVFDPRFLLQRPLLRALQPHAAGAPVLLIDEIDRADEPFEAFLLEVLSEFQVTVPELGTIRAAEPPIVVVTSNRTRELHDALKRRCLYHWVGYPDPATELEILRARLPGIEMRLAGQVVSFVQRLRREELYKAPGVAESLDWMRALMALGVEELTPEWTELTLGTLLKNREDIDRERGASVERLLAEARESSLIGSGA